MKDLKAGEASRTEILAWCLEHHFELVECDEGEEEEGDEDEDEGIEEKLGRARVVEALKVDSITRQNDLGKNNNRHILGVIWNCWKTAQVAEDRSLLMRRGAVGVKGRKRRGRWGSR